MTPSFVRAAAGIVLPLLTLPSACGPRELVVVDPKPQSDGMPAVDGGESPPDAVDARPGIPAAFLDGLVGYWRFDDGAGSAIAADASGNKNTGTLEMLNFTTGWVPGRSGGGVGIYAGGWVGVPASTSIDQLSNQLTVSAWVYFDGVIDKNMYGTAISRQEGTGLGQHYHLALYLGQPHLFVVTPEGAANLWASAAQNTVPQRTWTHLAGTYDGTTVRLFVNGTELKNLAAPLTGNLAAETNPVIIGGNGNDASGVPTELFPGALDEVMLYRRALSAAEIAQLAAGVLFPTGATDAGATN